MGLIDYPIIGTDIYRPQGNPFTPEADDIRIKHFMKKMGLTMKSNFGPYLDFYDVVEIYNHEGRQVYSNGRFYEITSVPMAELRTKPFYELFIRSEAIKKAVEQDFIKLMGNEAGKVVEMGTPMHTMSESCGENRSINVTFKYGSSLFDSEGKITHVICTADAEICKKPVFHVL